MRQKNFADTSTSFVTCCGYRYQKSTFPTPHCTATFDAFWQHMMPNSGSSLPIVRLTSEMQTRIAEIKPPKPTQVDPVLIEP